MAPQQWSSPGLSNSSSGTNTTSLKPCVVITGGGTGGHIFPALAVAEALQRQSQHALTCHFIGNANRMEATKAPQAGLPFTGITFAGMPRAGSAFEKLLLPFRLITWLLAWIAATWQVHQHFKTLRPRAIFATGGYVTAPVILAGLLWRLPAFLHEPDALPGRVNRLFGRWATHTTVAFGAAAKHFPPQRVNIVGNPVRKSLLNLPEAQAGYQHWFHDGMMKPAVRPVLLVMGGSLGATSINQAVLEALPTLINDMGLAVIHQVGDTHWDAFQTNLKTVGETWDGATRQASQHYYRPVAFIDAMPEALACATLAVCRSGSMTLSELNMAWLPALLVPYPQAAANHQWHNAQAVAKQGKAHVVADKDLSAEHLVMELQYLLKPQRINAMRRVMVEEASDSGADPNTPADVAALIAQTIQHKLGI